MWVNDAQPASAQPAARPWWGKRRVLLPVVGLFGIAVGAVAAGGGDSDESTINAAQPAPAVTVTAAPEPAPTVTVTAEPAAADPASYVPRAKDFKVSVKTLRKECFGSAGCNVAYRIVPTYDGTDPLPDEGEIEVTYSVSGGDDGPAINTFTIDSEGTAHYEKEENVGTPSSGSVLKAKVTDVLYNAD